MKDFENRKTRAIVGLTVGVLILVGAYLIIDSNKVTNQKDFKKFNESDISGIIKKINASSSGTHMYLSEGTRYDFTPTLSFDEYNYVFVDIAETGDSVIKQPFSPKITLKKVSGKEYDFRFYSP